MSSVEIIICTEKGRLESEAMLLIASLREFGGCLSNTPIYSYQPRKQFKISPSTAAFFSEHNVVHFDIPLNVEYEHYPLANKPLACAHREQHSNADFLIFLDSDVFFYNEPSALTDLNGSDVKLRPVDFKGVGSNMSGDENEEYWKDLYHTLGVTVKRTVESTVTGEKILEYYNSGHIVTKREIGLFTRWLKNFRRVMDCGLSPRGENLYFVEQTVFAATVSQMMLKVAEFEKEYNFPAFCAEGEIVKDRWKVDDFEQLVSLHYHRLFDREDGVHPLKHHFRTEKSLVLDRLLSENGVLRLPSSSVSRFYMSHRVKQSSDKITPA